MNENERHLAELETKSLKDLYKLAKTFQLTDYNHMKKQEEVNAWLQMYKAMQYNYHMGMALGIIAVAIFASAFRC
jgi:transcription termination factor Rho